MKSLGIKENDEETVFVSSVNKVVARRLNAFKVFFFFSFLWKNTFCEVKRVCMATQETENNDGKTYLRIIKQQSERENNLTMASKNNTKIILTGACILMLIVCCSVAVAR